LFPCFYPIQNIIQTYLFWKEKKGMKIIIAIALALAAAITIVNAQTPSCVYPIAPAANYTRCNASLLGYNILISGGSSNKSMGRAAALFYKSLGARRVVVFSRTPRNSVDHLEEFTSAGIEYYSADVTKEQSLSRLETRLKQRGINGFDIIFNTAGVTYFGDPNDMTHEQAKIVMNTNANGALNVWLTFKDMLKPNGTFAYVTSSTSDFLSPSMGVYSSSKQALERNMQHVAWSSSRMGVKFVSVVPGQADTNILLNAFRAEEPACPLRDKRMYDATVAILAQGQPAVYPAQALLSAHLYDAKVGQIHRIHSNNGPAGYGQYVGLSTIYYSNQQPQGAIDTYQSLFAPSGGDPFSLPC
jgi:NAD(P)-dependent dehydrogenase (short-subunit alcohol dehydrogenase family)